MNINFPTAMDIRSITDDARTYNMLVVRAKRAIMDAADNGLNVAEIPYESVDDATHLQFHRFITANGYEGGKSHLPKGYVYRIRW